MRGAGGGGGGEAIREEEEGGSESFVWFSCRVLGLGFRVCGSSFAASDETGRHAVCDAPSVSNNGSPASPILREVGTHQGNSRAWNGRAKRKAESRSPKPEPQTPNPNRNPTLRVNPLLLLQEDRPEQGMWMRSSASLRRGMHCQFGLRV